MFTALVQTWVTDNVLFVHKGPIRFCHFVWKTKFLNSDLHLNESISHRLINHMGCIAATKHMRIFSLCQMLHSKSYSSFINFVFLAKWENLKGPFVHNFAQSFCHNFFVHRSCSQFLLKLLPTFFSKFLFTLLFTNIAKKCIHNFSPGIFDNF